MNLTRCHMCGAPDLPGVAVCKRCGAGRLEASEPAYAYEGGREGEEAEAAPPPRPRPRPRPAPRAEAKKDCPVCFAPCALSAGSCPACGHRFPGVRARYVVIPVALALVIALFAAVRYFDEKAKETRRLNMQAGVGVPLHLVDPTTGVVETEARPTPQKPWFSSWFRSKPTAEEVFAHNVEVSGGVEALRQVKSHTAKGMLTFSLADSPNGYYYGADGRKTPPAAKLVSHAKSPDKFASELEMNMDSTGGVHGMTVRRGFDGKRGWEHVVREVVEPGTTGTVRRAELREFDGAELEQARRYAGAGLVRTSEQYRSLVMLDNRKVVPVTHHGLKQFERDCYVVRALNHQDKLETFYFDIDDGRLLRFDFDAQGPDGPTTIECYPDDYRKVEDVVLPFRMTFRADGMWMTVAFSEFKLNAPVLDSTFEPPTS